MKLGKVNTLRIGRETPVGLFLADESGKEVLLPNRYVPGVYAIGDSIDVFVYNDSEDRLVATTETPLATVESFAMLEVVDTNYHGAFLNWGLMKDLFVPRKEQRSPMHIGGKYLVYVYVDEVTERLVATSKLEKVLDKNPEGISPGDEVELLVWLRNEPGYSVIVNGKYAGMVYHNQVYQEISEGERLKGYVQQVRADGKLDILLQEPGVGNIASSSEILLQKLVDNNGFLALTDNSTPGEITAQLQMSKKAFKRALGALYKQRKVAIEETGIRLLTK